MKRQIILICALMGVFTSVISYAQDSLKINTELLTLKDSLDFYSLGVPALNEKVNISVSDVSIQEFLRAVAHEANLNINVDPSLSMKVINNFSDVKAKDILQFICEEYSLKISFIGNIITIYKEPEKQVPPQKKITLFYNENTDIITLDYSEAVLADVAKEITHITGKNIVLSPGLGGNKVSGYIKDKPFEQAMEKFAYANNLTLKKTEDQFFLLNQSKIDTRQANISGNYMQDYFKTSEMRTIDPDSYELKIDIFKDSISVYAVNAPVIEAIKQVSDRMGVNYFMTTEIQGQQTFSVKKANYEEFLEYLLNGSDYTFRAKDNIYFVGKSSINELKEFKVIQLQYRTVDTLISIIPEDLKSSLKLKEFTELNSLLVGGSSTQIRKLEDFIREIDKVVPVILIEVIIIDFNKYNKVSTGIKMGVDGTATAGNKVILPEPDYQFSPSTINNLINSFNGFGWFKIGKVSPSFYSSIQALENNGNIKVRSTPKLSTLNGHKATLESGVKTYYKEETSNFQGSLSPLRTDIRVYKELEAKLKIEITPIVSGDEQITMKIAVDENNFLPMASNPEGRPPDSKTRKFESQIRVKNQEMVLLGGLEEQKTGDTGSGVPFLSRIPILKWFFSNRAKEKSETKLNIFIKPTIIY